MNSLSITALTFVCTFGGAMLGMLLRPRLPGEHLSADTRDTVKLATGIVGTMTAVLLGLLVASAKSSFDVQRSGVAQVAANVIVLDRTLAHFGEESGEIREALRGAVTDIIQRTWPEESARTGTDLAPSETEGRYEVVFDKILALSPKTDGQRVLQPQALKVITDTGQLRWLLFSQRESSIPIPLLALMVFWLAISFASFGLFAPRNTTAVIALIACALAVSSALFLILELDRPFRGVIQISSIPLHRALEQLGR
jgi:hypothetical protein